MIINNIKDLLEYVKITKLKVYIWGIGINGKRLGMIFNEYGINWNGYFDNFNYNITEVNGKTVYLANELVNNLDSIFIISMKDYKDVLFQLSGIIDESRLVYFDKISFYRELEKFDRMDNLFQKRIEQFKDCHSGEKCFIIGNGPSLIGSDLNKIKKSGIDSFACNEIFMCYGNVEWRPKYYFCSDVTGIVSVLDKKENASEAFSNCDFAFLRNMKESLYFSKKFKNVIVYNQIYPENELSPEFSYDCSYYVYIGHTVMYVMLQFAIYMGYNEIYLLGVDHQFSKERKSNGRVVNKNIQDHSEILKTKNVLYFDIDKATAAYISAKKNAESRKIKIYNATRGGMLDVFERIDFDELF